MLNYNPHLGALAHGSKGGGMLIEDAAHVENIIFQTRGGPLCAFEQRFSDDLMQVFGEGHATLHDVVAALVGRGSLDADGTPWTEASFTTQLAHAAAGLFAPVAGAIDG